MVTEPAPPLDSYRLAIDTIPGLVWTAMPDGRVDFLNRRWLEFTGLAAEEAAGWGWQVAVCPDDLPHLLNFWRSLLESGRPGEFEVRLRRHDGVDRWFLFRAVPLHDEHGAVAKWYGQTIDIEDRKRAEDEAKKQSAHLDELFELAPHAVVLVDDEVRVIRMNREFVRMFGYTEDEAVGRRLEDLVAPEERMGEYRNNARLLSGGQKVEMETVRRRKDGVRLHVSMTASPVLTAGPIEGYIIYRDITARKRDEALLAGERRLLELMATGQPIERTLGELCRLVEAQSPSSLCSVMFVDPEARRLRSGVAPSLPMAYLAGLDGRPIAPDEGPCSVSAWLREAVIVEDIATAPLPEDYRALALAHGLRSCWSIPLLSLDQRVLGTFALYHRQPRLPGAEESGIIGQVQHLASIAIERTQVEDRLRRSQALLAEAERLTHTGSFAWRVADDEITWSDETYRIYGVQAGTRPTRSLIGERVHPDDGPAWELALSRAAERAGDFALEYRLRLPDGTVKHLQAIAHVASREGDPLEYVGTVMDVTERKRSEDALDRARLQLAHVSRVTTLGQMAASIAHEINQPLAGIVINANACLRWLAADPPDLQGANDAARRIVRDGQRAGDVIARLRSLFRRTGAVREELHVDEVVREVLALARAELQGAGVLLHTALARNLPPVLADRVQLQQLLLNLILNAVEAMAQVPGRTPELNVGAMVEEGAVLVTVRDSGVGLEPAEVERIFDPFYTTKEDGMGMGLAISRSIAENNGGRLWAEPNGGPGATFTVSLPAQSGPVAVT